MMASPSEDSPSTKKKWYRRGKERTKEEDEAQKSATKLKGNKVFQNVSQRLRLKFTRRLNHHSDYQEYYAAEYDETEICSVAKHSSIKRDMADELEWDNVGAWLPENRLWKGERRLIECLRVYFFDNEVKNQMYQEKPLTPDVIMEIINEHWDKMDEVENNDCVPKFQRVYDQMAEVRVQFKSNHGSWSRLGSAAEGVPLSEPTVILNFDCCRNDFDIQAMILHQFGHVLGLGHMHQGPQYWSIITKFIDIQMMLESLNISKKEFDTQWCKAECHGEDFYQHDYDEDSIMHYQTKLCWLQDPKYMEEKNLEYQKEINDITEDEYKALKEFHKHLHFVHDKPSKADKSNLVQAYHDMNEKLSLDSTSTISDDDDDDDEL